LIGAAAGGQNGDLQYLCDMVRTQISLPSDDAQNTITEDLARYAIGRHRIGPLVFKAVHTNLQKNDPSSSAIDLLERSYRENTRKILTQRAASKSLTDLLDKHAVPYCNLKGDGLAQQIYNDPGLRQSVDIDILIPEEKSRLAIQLMNDAGYHYRPYAMNRNRQHGLSRQVSNMKRFKDLTFVDPKFGTAIELHQRFFTIEPNGFTSYFYRSNRSATIPSITNSHYCLYLILHGAIAHWPRLKWVIDLSLLLRKMPASNLEEVLQLATRFGCFDAVIASVQLVENIFPGSLNTDWLREMDKHRDSLSIARTVDVFLGVLASNASGNPDLPAKRPLFSDSYRLIFGDQISISRILKYRIANSIALRT